MATPRVAQRRAVGSLFAGSQGSLHLQTRLLSTAPRMSSAAQDKNVSQDGPEQSRQKEQTKQEPAKKEKSMAERDEEVRLKLEGLSGDGGASGVEYENGKAGGLKRSVKDNMFRYI